MTTYRLVNNIFEYHEAFVDFRALRKQFNDLKVWFNQDNESLQDKLKAEWIPVSVNFDSDRKTNVIPDISVWNSSCLVLSSKAYRSLKELLENSGEFLPLEEGCFLYNCLNSVSGDAVDHEKTSIDIDSIDSAHIPKSLALLDDKIKDMPVFKPGFLHNGFLVCQDEFKEIAEKNELGGVIFEKNLAQMFPSKG